MSKEEAKVSRKGGYEMMFGVILPIMCLLLDPIVFQSRLPGRPMLGVIWLSGYFFVVTQIILFVVWLWFGHRIKVMSVWFAGFFSWEGVRPLGLA